MDVETVLHHWGPFSWKRINILGVRSRTKHTDWLPPKIVIKANEQTLPVQTTVCDSLHCVKVAVRPVDPLCYNVKGEGSGCAKPFFDELEAITAIHEGALELGFLLAETFVCEKHVAANRRKQQIHQGISWGKTSTNKMIWLVSGFLSLQIPFIVSL